MEVYFVFFFQAEDGIRDVAVTGVQTCALPICSRLAISTARGPSGASQRTSPPVPDIASPSTTAASPVTSVRAKRAATKRGEIPGRSQPTLADRKSVV